MEEGRKEGSDDSSARDSDGDGAEDIHDLDLRVSVDVASMHRSSAVPVTRADTLLLKFILATSLYPRVAVADGNNKQRRNQDCK